MAVGRRRRRHQQRALRHPRAAPARHRARRGARAAVRSTRSTAGSPPRRSRTCAARGSRNAASRAGPARWRARSTIARACAFDLRLAAPELPDHDVPDGHTEMTWLRELTARGARVRYPSTHSHARAGDAPDRARARRDRAAQLPRLLPGARRHRRVLPHRTTSTARGGGARPTARSATRSASPRPTRSRSACCSSASSRSSATARPTSTSTSSTSGARR